MTHVHITIDTEFSSCGYFNAPPTGHPVGEQAVRCVVNGRSEGLGFLLSTFAEHGVRATFFVEALHTTFFGDDPMGAIAREIHFAGHDVQLHLHPSWMACMAPGARDRPTRPAADNLAELDRDAARQAIVQGLEAFDRWGVPRPTAFRAGNLQASPPTYEALASVGIPVASNLGLGVFRPSEPELQIMNGRRAVRGVVEVPVTTYRELWPTGAQRLKTLSITGSSFAEMKQIISMSRDAGLEDVVLLTHPFEFVKRGDGQYERLIRNRINQRRLIALCRHVADPRNGLRSATFRERTPAWLAQRGQGDANLRVSSLHALCRIGINLANDRIWRL
jgi:peptidoglycan/xylan/chitin deacetylase (PgdA/CDA1 family)